MNKANIISISLLFIFLFTSCGEGPGCPDGMKERILPDGTEICVPNGI